MLIISKALTEGIQEAKFDKNKIKVTHAEDVTDVMRLAEQCRKDPRGNWSKEKRFRLCGTIPNLVYFAILKKYPDIAAKDPKEKQKTWRRVFKDPEFEMYSTGGSL